MFVRAADVFVVLCVLFCLLLLVRRRLLLSDVFLAISIIAHSDTGSLSWPSEIHTGFAAV